MPVPGTITFCSTELRPSARCDLNHNAMMVNLRYFKRKSSVVHIYGYEEYIEESKSMSCDALNLSMPDISGTTVLLWEEHSFRAIETL